jgi:tripartite-type tricarboxylate transporter receptor subunit TctC
MQTRRGFLTSLAAIGAVTTNPRAWAADYPSRPITVVVPYAAGSSSDALARLVTARMGASLGQPIVIADISGAAGTIGVGRVARAAPDGYTLVEGNWSTHVANSAIYALPYDVVADFQPIALIASSPLLIAARETVPANTLKELIAWLQANPGKASYGTNGPGSIMHLASLMFQKEIGAPGQVVPYRGGSAAIKDLISGQIDIMIYLPPDILPHMRSHSIKVFAVGGKNRLESAPDIPTVGEAGLPGFYVSAWFALWAPGRTPPSIIARLNAAIVNALADPSVERQLKDLGFDIPPRERQTPEALESFQKVEIDRWRPIVKEAGISPQ